jgi:anti-sigma regulatory factor (Ser/Thr protein kinase)
VKIQAGDRLFLFTDGCFGLMNANGETPISYAKFLEFLQDYGRLPLETVYAGLHLKLLNEIGNVSTEDDRTFIAIEISKPPLSERYKYLLHFDNRAPIRRRRIGKRKDMDELLDQIVNELEQGGYSERVIVGICNSIQEVVINALVHGHKGDTSLKASIAWSVSAECFRFSVVDKGAGYDKSNMGPGHARRGNGLLLVRTYMDEVFIEENGRSVTLLKNRA